MMCTILKLNTTTQRGFTLLIAMIFVAVILSVGLTLTNVSYKQVILASTARQSEYAFYNADSGMECVLYLDQQSNAFDYNTEPVVSNSTYTFNCPGRGVSATSYAPNINNNRITNITIGCPSSRATQSNVSVTVLKKPFGSTPPTTIIYSNGFNNCNASDPNRVERGLKAQY